MKTDSKTGIEAASNFGKWLKNGSRKTPQSFTSTRRKNKKNLQKQKADTSQLKFYWTNLGQNINTKLSSYCVGNLVELLYII